MHVNVKNYLMQCETVIIKFVHIALIYNFHLVYLNFFIESLLIIIIKTEQNTMPFTVVAYYVNKLNFNWMLTMKKTFMVAMSRRWAILKTTLVCKNECKKPVTFQLFGAYTLGVKRHHEKNRMAFMYRVCKLMPWKWNYACKFPCIFSPRKGRNRDTHVFL